MAERKRALIAEDDEDIAELEASYLLLGGIEADIEGDGDKAMARALAGNYDILLLDVMMPGATGMEICQAVRAEQEIPILMVTACKEDVDKIRGLGMGADDYIVKPFSPNELLARVKAHLSRYERLKGLGQKEQAEKKELIHGNLRLLPKEMRAFLDDREISLPPREFQLLEYFLEHPRQVFSREELFEAVWGQSPQGDIATVTVHIKRLREKIEENVQEPDHIETVWGKGYRLKSL